ncbi:MAG: hypothetical protein II007_03885 [Gammaproteobacteria bacterium]|nr:hypothetical protein [Gammaproteobacteria bacterium]
MVADQPVTPLLRDELAWWLAQREATASARHTTCLQLARVDQQFQQWFAALDGSERRALQAVSADAGNGWPVAAASGGDELRLTTALALQLAEYSTRTDLGWLDLRQQALVRCWQGEWQHATQLPVAGDRLGLAQALNQPEALVARCQEWLSASQPLLDSDLHWLGVAARETDAPALVSLLARSRSAQAAIAVAAASGWCRFVPWLAELLGVSSLRHEVFAALELLLGEQMASLLPSAILAEEQPWLDDDAVNLLQRQLCRRWQAPQGARLLAGRPLRSDGLADIWRQGRGPQRNVAAAHLWLQGECRWQPAAAWMGGIWPCA